MDKIIIIIWITFGIYIMVLFAIMADLWAGVRKARINGIVRSSYGFKRTVDKIAKYFNVLMAFTIIDVMQMGALCYLTEFYGCHYPIFPFITLLGAIGICLIEIKSIFEKAEDKVRIENVASMAEKVFANKNDLSKVIKVLMDYMETPDGEKLKDNILSKEKINDKNTIIPK